MPDERTESQSDDSAVRAAKKTWPAQPSTLEADPSGPPSDPPDRAGTAPLSDADVRLSQLLSQRVFAVPGYKPVRQLGQGTYGVVWLAEEESTGIRVAVKFFAHGAGEEWQMLQGEVKQLASLHDDPGIVELIDVGLTSFPPYYIMRYCEGGSLAHRLEKGCLPLDEALRLFKQICEALAYVHVKGIRHCDLKPGNILLDARGKALVADFGQAHLSTDASPALGTFFYMAPEQADLTKQIPDTRWDVYGLGALLYVMVTGHPPREDSTLHQALRDTARLAHRLELYRERIGTAPRPAGHRQVPGIDRELIGLIDGCLELDPNQRPRDAGEVLQLLARRERRRRQRPVIVAAVLAPLVLVLLMGGLLALVFEDAQRSIRDQQNQHTIQVRERNQHIAELVANDVRVRLRKRIEMLRRMAEDDAFADYIYRIRPGGLMAHDAERQLDAWLRKEIPLTDGKAAARRGKASERLWDTVSVVTPEGYIVSLILSDGTSAPRAVRENPYTFRDWFHGQGEKPDHFRGKMVTATYVSEPYTSRLEGHPLMITISVPIDSEGTGQVGLLTMSLEMKHIDEWFGKLKLDNTFAVLLNQKGQYLFHPDTAQVRPREAGKSPPPLALQLPADLRQTLARGEGGTHEQPFPDPVRRDRTYEAAFAPVGNPFAEAPWTVMIQTEYHDEPPGIAELRETFWKTSIIALAVVGIALPLLWTWVLRTLRRQE